MQHWRHHAFSGIRPSFCHIEAVETAVWLTEVAPNEKAGKAFLDHLEIANNDANPQLSRGFKGTSAASRGLVYTPRREAEVHGPSRAGHPVRSLVRRRGRGRLAGAG